MKKIEEEFVKEFDRSLGNQNSFEEIKDKINLVRFQKKKTSSRKAMFRTLGMATAFILLAAIIIPSAIYLLSPSDVPSTGGLPSIGNNPSIGDDPSGGKDVSRVVSISVTCDYGNIKKGKATLVLSAPINIEQYQMKSKANSQTINNIIVGDTLEVSYKEENTISQVLVDTADYMVVNVEGKYPPGGGTIDIFIYVEGDQSNVPVILHEHLLYIIDENGSLINKAEAYKYERLYAVFTKENIEDNGLYTVITLTAIYTCDPRTVSLDYVEDDKDIISNPDNTVLSITDIPRFSSMQNQADKIDVDLDNYNGKIIPFSITDTEEIAELMDVIFKASLYKMSAPIPSGNSTFITIYQGNRSYTFSVCYISENGNNYRISNSLLDKIMKIAWVHGVYDTE